MLYKPLLQYSGAQPVSNVSKGSKATELAQPWPQHIKYCRQLAQGLPCPAEMEGDDLQGLLAILACIISSLDQHSLSSSSAETAVLVLAAVQPLCLAQHLAPVRGAVVPLSLLGELNSAWLRGLLPAISSSHPCLQRGCSCHTSSLQGR